MGFNIKVNEDYLTAKLSTHLSHLKPECVKQIAEVLMTSNSTINDVIFKSLDGYVFPEPLHAPGDTATVHMDRLYTHRYNEDHMRKEGIIQENNTIDVTIISVDKYNEAIRVSYPYISNDGERYTTEWSIETRDIIKTVGLARPNLDELI